MPLSDTLVGDQLSWVRRPLWFRSLITLWGIWFATALTEPAGFLACPMHSGMGHHASSVQVAETQVTETPSDVDDHSGHDAHRAEPALEVSATESDAPEPSHVCSCLGDCCSSVPAQAADPIDVPRMVVIGDSGQIRPESNALTALTARDHALPFAIGPPIAPAA